jgi:hypothetical protein
VHSCAVVRLAYGIKSAARTLCMHMRTPHHAGLTTALRTREGAGEERALPPQRRNRAPIGCSRAAKAARRRGVRKGAGRWGGALLCRLQAGVCGAAPGLDPRAWQAAAPRCGRTEGRAPSDFNARIDSGKGRDGIAWVVCRAVSPVVGARVAGRAEQQVSMRRGQVCRASLVEAMSPQLRTVSKSNVLSRRGTRHPQ